MKDCMCHLQEDCDLHNTEGGEGLYFSPCEVCLRFNPCKCQIWEWEAQYGTIEDLIKFAEREYNAQCGCGSTLPPELCHSRK